MFYSSNSAFGLGQRVVQVVLNSEVTLCYIVWRYDRIYARGQGWGQNMLRH